MHQRLLRPLVVAGLIGGVLLAYGCWRDQETPTDAVVQGPVPPRYPFPFPGLVGPVALESPLRIVVTDDGQLLVSDARVEMVLAIDPSTLRPTHGFKSGGKPLAIGATRDLLFVGYAGKKTVELYDARTGAPKGSFGPPAIEYPIDLGIDEDAGLVFVLDTKAGQVKVFDDRGMFQGTISSRGRAPEQLISPMGIAVDPARGEVLVSDWGDHGNANGGTASIKIFGYDGTLIDVISGAGSCGLMECFGGFSRPHGLEVDGRGRIYVADALLAQVLVFERATMEQVGTVGDRPSLRVPTDVAFGANGELYVTSSRTASIEVIPGGAQ